MSRLIRPLSGLLLPLMLVSVTPAVAPPGNLDRYGDPLPRGAAARMGSVRFRMACGDTSLALSPDGKHAFVTSSVAGAVSVTDVATGLSRRLPSPKFKGGAVPQTLVLAPACDRVLAHVNAELVLYDVQTGKTRWSIKAPAADTAPVFDPTGKHFARYEPDAKQMGEGTVFVHRADNGKQIASQAVKGLAVQFALTPGGTRLLCWNQQALALLPRPAWEVAFFDVSKGKEVARVQIRTGLPTVTFRPDGKEVAIAAGSAVSLLDPANARVMRTFRSAPAATTLCYSLDGKYLAAVGYRRAELWDAKTWKRLPTRILPDSVDAAALAFPAPGQLLVATMRGREVVFTDARSGKSLRSPSGHEAPVTSLHFTGSTLLTAGSDGKVMTWTLAGRLLGQITAMTSPDWLESSRPIPAFAPALLRSPLAPGDQRAGRLEFSPSGRWVVGDSGFVFDRRAGETRFDELTDVGGEGGGAEAVCIARDVDVLFTAGLTADAVNRQGAASLTALRVDNGEQLWSVAVRGLSPFRVAASPDGKTVALMTPTAEGQFSVRLFDGKTGKRLAGSRDYETEGTPGTLLEFSDDGRILVGRDDHGGLFLLDGRSGELLHSVQLEGSLTCAVRLCRRGRMVAVALTQESSQVQTIQVVELSTGKARLSFAPSDVVTALRFSPDGKYLASGNEDGTALLWHLEPDRFASKVDLWKRLSGKDAADAWRAAWQLRRDPANAVALVNKHVKKAPPGPSAADVKRLITALDDEEGNTRDEAEQTLRKHGRSVESPLRTVLKGSPSAEAGRRVKRLIAALPSLYANVAGLRGVELLEAIGTESARKSLAELARGNESAAQTREAKTALARLTKRPPGDSAPGD